MNLDKSGLVKMHKRQQRQHNNEATVNLAFSHQSDSGYGVVDQLDGCFKPVMDGIFDLISANVQAP